MTTSSLAAPESRILVPLDGSPRAERALPIALRLALALQRPLVLARIVPLVHTSFAAAGAPVEPAVYQQLLDDERDEAHAYLEQQARLLRRQEGAQGAPEIVVETVVMRGDAASALLTLCADRPIGLVVMTTHGRTGVARVALGSVADRLIRNAFVPTLTIHTSLGLPTTQHSDAQDPQALVRALDHLILPLDGSPVAEAALPLAEAIAGRVAHEITLLQVIPYTATTSERKAVDDYLAAQQRALRSRLGNGGPQVTTVVHEGVAANEKIVQFANERVGMVVMATHGRGGLRRLALGSVAAAVIHQSSLPVLVLEPTPLVS